MKTMEQRMDDALQAIQDRIPVDPTNGMKIYNPYGRRSTDIVPPEEPEHKRTQYVIRHTTSGMYMNDSASRHWTSDVDTALRFDFMTSAEGFAIVQLGMDPATYTVVPVEGK